MLAVLAWQLEKNSYVVSHGVPSVLVPFNPVSPWEGRYASSITFVNSEFEKSIYQNIHFDSKKLIATGMPRYDRMFQLREDRAKRLTDAQCKCKQILYCSAQLTDFDFDYPLTVISLNNGYGFYTKRYAKDIFSIVSQFNDVHLKIKPHYNDEDVWRKYLNSFEKSVSYELLSHKANIFELLIAADLILTIESTVICEAIILKKPVIVLNYSPEELCSPEYDDDGLILHARNPGDLSRMVRQALEDQQYREELAKSQEKHFVRYAGSFDGHNADRVADYIIESELRQKKAVCDVNSK